MLQTFLNSDFVSILSSVVVWFTFAITVWGIVFFYPRDLFRPKAASSYLILAIWLGFLGNGLNILYWRIAGDLLVQYDVITVYQLRTFGAGIGDTVWKGIAGISVYMHFYARWSSLPEKERHHWTPVTVGLHPNWKHWTVSALSFWKISARRHYYERNRDFKTKHPRKGK